MSAVFETPFIANNTPKFCYNFFLIGGKTVLTLNACHFLLKLGIVMQGEPAVVYTFW